jgi:hypothetical protein
METPVGALFYTMKDPSGEDLKGSFIICNWCGEHPDEIPERMFGYSEVLEWMATHRRFVRRPEKDAK